MKKKVIFVTNPMYTGGIEQALIYALTKLDWSDYDVTVMLTRYKGEMISCLPKWVHVVELPLRPLDRFQFNYGRVPVLKHALLTGHWLYAVKMLWARLLWDIGGRKGEFNFIQMRGMVRRAALAESERVYDYAFAWAGGIAASCVVRYLIKASRTAVWIHDESAASWLTDLDFQAIFKPFGRRFAPSMQLVQMLNGRFGEGQFELLPYLTDFAEYRAKAMGKDSYTDEFNGLRLLTVGRLADQKGIDDAIRISARLKADGLSFRWYVVGDGKSQPSLERQIAEMGVEDCFILLGRKSNPYPFIRDCDIYLQPSRFEAYCLTVAEARAFNKPIVATDFAGARDQLIDGETGLITPLSDIDAFYKATKRLIEDEKFRMYLAGNLQKSEETDMSVAKAKWMNLLGEESFS